MRVYLVLEMIHQRAVGKERDRAREVAVQKLARIGAEEFRCPWLGKELHRHGMHLAGLHARPDIFHRHTSAVDPRGKGMPCLVRYHLDIVLRAVEVGKNKRDAVVGDGGTVAAGLLALCREHVQQLALAHGTEELGRLGAEVVIKSLPLGQDLLRRALRLRVARAKLQRVIGKAHRVLPAQPRGLPTIDAVRNRHYIFYHGGAEFFHVLFGIAVAAHAVVAKRGIALAAQLFAHAVPQAHQLVVQAVELGLVFFIPAPLRLPRGQTARVVRILLKGRQLRKRIHAALEGDLRRGNKLIIRLTQIVFALQLRNDLRRKGL